jgi:hypothetical protein
MNFTTFTVKGAKMADRSGLGSIGLMLGTATLLVALVGAFVVTDTIIGNLPLDSEIGAAALPSTAR